jgi:O-antigen/teichoic acid export membrane protein
MIRGLGRRSVTLFLGAGAAQGVVLLSLPIIGRLYGASEFGLMTLLVALAGFGSQACLRLEYAVPKARSDREAQGISAAAMALGAVTTLLVSAGALSWMATSAAHHRQPEVLAFTACCAFGILGTAMTSVLTMNALRRGLDRDVSLSRLAQAVTQVAIQVAGGFLAGGVTSLLVGVAVGRCASAAWLLWRMPDVVHLRGVRVLRLARAAAARHWRFAMLGGPAALLHQVTTGLPVFLLTALHGREITGLFAMADRLLRAPLDIIGGAVAQAFYATAAGADSKNRTMLRPMMMHLAKRMAPFAAVGLLAVAVVGPRVLPVVLGPQWIGVGEYLAVLVIPAFVYICVGPVFNVLHIVGAQKALLACECIGLGMMVGLMAGAARLWHDPLRTVMGYAVAFVVMYAALMIAALSYATVAKPDVK